MNEMKAIAHKEHMKFVDGSVQAKRDIEAAGLCHQRGPIIHFALEHEKEVVLLGGNLGLPGYQIQMGFFENSNSKEAYLLSRRTIKTLKEDWSVSELPFGAGAYPLRNCGQNPQNRT